MTHTLLHVHWGRGRLGLGFICSYRLCTRTGDWVKCELRNCEWVFCEFKCELAHDWSAIFRTTRSLPSANAIVHSMNLRVGNNKTCILAHTTRVYAYVRYNCSNKRKKELIHHLLLSVFYTHRTMRFMALHACTSQINFKSCAVQCGSSVLRLTNGQYGGDMPELHPVVTRDYRGNQGIRYGAYTFDVIYSFTNPSS